MYLTLSKSRRNSKKVTRSVHCYFNCITVKFERTQHSILRLSKGEVCVANFIPPANGASQGIYFLPKTEQLPRAGIKPKNVMCNDD